MSYGLAHHLAIVDGRPDLLSDDAVTTIHHGSGRLVGRPKAIGCGALPRAGQDLSKGTTESASSLQTITSSLVGIVGQGPIAAARRATSISNRFNGDALVLSQIRASAPLPRL